MKSRTSFFDKTVLKKDLTRFFPLWALYLIGGLLIMHILSGFYSSYYSNRGYSIARDLNNMIGPLSILSAGYAFLAAQLLFGDLHNTRLCYGVHALPLRREGWYLTHVISGLLMGLVPPLVILLTLMPLMGQFWFTALLCYGGMVLHYLFFFGLASLCMMLTGNRFAATAVYGLLNFLSLIIRWFVQTVYLPLLPGVRANTTVFDLFSPLVEAIGRDDFFLVSHADNCTICQHQWPGFYPEMDGGSHAYIYQGLGGDWGYLWVLAGVGIALLAGGLLLYRIRHLERAGDFMAFKPMKPIFLWVYTLSVGVVMFYLADEAAGPGAGYLFLVIGIFIGYFTGKMLLERTLRVFKGRSWAGLGILYAAVALSLLLTWIDPVGITRRIPKADKVERVYISQNLLSDYQLNHFEHLPNYNNVITITNPEHIAEITQIHGLMLEENELLNNHSGTYVTLQYHLKNGGHFSRSYRILVMGEAQNRLHLLMKQPRYALGFDTLEQLKRNVLYLDLDVLDAIPATLLDSALEALWKDTELGYVYMNPDFLGQPLSTIRMEYSGGGGMRLLYFNSNAPHLSKWILNYSTSPELLLKYESPGQLIKYTKSIYFPDLQLELSQAQYHQFLPLLWEDCAAGKVRLNYKFSSRAIWLELDCGLSSLTLYISEDGQCAKWLNALNAQSESEP